MSEADIPERSEPTERRDRILEASSRLLLRYGFRKSSMDEVARAAGISRQGLYLYFATKDVLFEATINYLLESTRAMNRGALTEPGISLQSRVVNAFAQMAGDSLAPHLEEVLEVAERLTRQPASELEGLIIGGFATALDATPPSSPWRRNGDDSLAVAKILYATATGLSRIATDPTDYADLMSRAVALAFAPQKEG